MKRFFLTLSLLPLISSCSTMQSHKNIELIGSKIEGSELSPPQHVYQSNGKHYLKLNNYLLQKKYPLFHDPIFLGVENPHYVKLSESQGISYYPISNGTAKILLQSNGYASLPILMSEIKEQKTPPLKKLSNASALKVLSQIEPCDSLPIIHGDIPKQDNIGINIISWLDLIFVDSVGTVGYNVAIPLMAPFYFFSDFSQNINKNPFDNN